MKKRVNNWLSPKLDSRGSDKHGMGVFALKDISKNEVLAVFGGQVISRDERSRLSEHLSHLFLGIDDDLFIGPRSESETDDAEWFNHSCNPNAGLMGQIILVAMRTIKGGEEITFDYCMSCSQKGQRRVLFTCDCGSSNCRQEVTNQDWMLPDLQQKYKGYFSPFVQRNIDSLR